MVRADDNHYRPCVGVMLFDAYGRVFVGKRIGMADAWQMPQGGIDKGESPAEAGLRELKEEIGTEKAEIVAETDDWLHYDFPPEVAATRWKGRWKGQRQKWLACRFTGLDDDIDLATEHPEFDAWKWVAIKDLVTLIVPFKKPVYRAVVEALEPKVIAAIAPMER